MRLKNKFSFFVFPLLTLISGCGHAQSNNDIGAIPPTTPFPVASDATQGFASSDQAAYDDVGYASVALGDDARSISENSSEANPLAITAAHKSLPVPSYAEVTNLDTGRTILVRINGKNVSTGRLITLSPGAARQLNVEGASRIPVRVRRTNPPEFERATLRQGQAAGERIETPPALLAALRKKLGVTPADPVLSRPKAAIKAPVKSRPVDAGADFDAPSRAASVDREDRFIVEDGSTKRRLPPVRGAASGGPAFFVQVAAFSNETRARSLARELDGSVVNAGSIWRVRKGPFGNEEEARASLGVMIAKGYRDARVAR